MGTRTSAPTAPSAIILSRLLRSINSECVVSRVDYWEYEICINGRARQYHGNDQYSLATQARVDDAQKVLFLENGALCDGTNRPRSIRVNFGCQRSARRPILHSIVEPSICQYDATIAWEAVCSDASYPLISLEPSSISSPSSTGDGGGVEGWLLDIHMLSNGVALCQLSSNEVSSLVFEKFQLQLDNPQSPAVDPVVVASSYIAKKSIHESISSIALEFVHLQQHRRTVLASREESEAFDGKISFIKIYA